MHQLSEIVAIQDQHEFRKRIQTVEMNLNGLKQILNLNGKYQTRISNIYLFAIFIATFHFNQLIYLFNPLIPNCHKQVHLNVLVDHSFKNEISDEQRQCKMQCAYIDTPAQEFNLRCEYKDYRLMIQLFYLAICSIAIYISQFMKEKKKNVIIYSLMISVISSFLYSHNFFNQLPNEQHLHQYNNSSLQFILSFMFTGFITTLSLSIFYSFVNDFMPEEEFNTQKQRMVLTFLTSQIVYSLLSYICPWRTLNLLFLVPPLVCITIACIIIFQDDYMQHLRKLRESLIQEKKILTYVDEHKHLDLQHQIKSLQLVRETIDTEFEQLYKTYNCIMVYNGLSLSKQQFMAILEQHSKSQVVAQEEHYEIIPFLFIGLTLYMTHYLHLFKIGAQLRIYNHIIETNMLCLAICELGGLMITFRYYDSIPHQRLLKSLLVLLGIFQSFIAMSYYPKMHQLIKIVHLIIFCLSRLLLPLYFRIIIGKLSNSLLFIIVIFIGSGTPIFLDFFNLPLEKIFYILAMLQFMGTWFVKK